jgi:hypothetical protein
MNPEITDPKALEVYRDTRKIRKDLIESLGLAFLLASVAITFLVCVLIYNLQPTRVDMEQQAIRAVELKKMQDCVSHGASWMPVRKSGSSTSEMSCVTSETLPMVSRMNERS